LKVYVGLVSKGSVKAKEIRREGWGVVLVPELRKKFCPETFPLYFVDNGAYTCWRRGESFNSDLFLRTLEEVSTYQIAPQFVVIPDLVAKGLKSLEFSLNWLDRLKQGFPNFNYALAVQDGMKLEDVEPYLNEVAYLFVGGTLKWKITTGKEWVELARRYGKKCHVGRVGTAKRVRWARKIGADSIDSALPLFSLAKWERFKKALRETLQPELPFRGTLCLSR